MRIYYDILTPKGELYEKVYFEGEDEEDCREQLEQYLSTKQDCYGQAVEEEGDAKWQRDMRLLELDIREMSLTELTEWLCGCHDQEAYEHIVDYLIEEYGFTETFFNKWQPWWLTTEIPDIS